MLYLIVPGFEDGGEGEGVVEGEEEGGAGDGEVEEDGGRGNPTLSELKYSRTFL